MAARLIWPALGALLLTGCFSSADFQECTSSVQCGLGFRCEANACVPQAANREVGPVDFSGRPDMGGEAVEIIEGGRFTEEQGDQSYPGKTLVLRGVIVVDSPSGVTFSADHIRLEGTLEVLGPGGGPGGGGGAAGHDSLSFTPGGSADSPQRGAVATGTTGGDGGTGGRGLGLNGGQAGAPGEQGDPDGQPGGDGRFPITSCDDQATLQVGCSGGGGGGGRGANGAAACEGGGGGGGGGAGGRAGGAVALEATGTITITIDGQIIAAGSAGTVSPGADTLGGPPCGADCGGDCDAARNGFGGDGARAGGPGQGGGEGAGSGGPGGGGSGGMIRLRAASIQVPASGQALLDVQGGGADNGGVVVVIGDVDGPLEVRGESLRCP